MKPAKTLYSILTFLPIIISLFIVPILPEQIPAHYNLAGEVDRYGSRLEILSLPIFILIMSYLFRWFAAKTLAKKPQLLERAFFIGGNCMLTVFNAILFVMLYTSFVSLKRLSGPEGSITQIFNIILGIALIVTGNIMPKVKRNAVFGLRTKWSMANDTCWNLSQRFGGLSFMIIGTLIVIGSLLITDPALLIILMLTLILLDIVFCVVYSYQVYQKHGKS